MVVAVPQQAVPPNNCGAIALRVCAQRSRAAAPLGCTEMRAWGRTTCCCAHVRVCTRAGAPYLAQREGPCVFNEPVVGIVAQHPRESGRDDEAGQVVPLKRGGACVVGQARMRMTRQCSMHAMHAHLRHCELGFGLYLRRNAEDVLNHLGERRHGC